MRKNGIFTEAEIIEMRPSYHMKPMDDESKELKSKEEEDDAFDRTIEEIKERNYNIDLCGYPHEEEEILPPKDLIQQYQEKRASLNADIDNILSEITSILGIEDGQ